ncbi:MAG TPA: methylated-DNA--[protein]-cysteine S-methyltransferase [Candidatus Latescibacteria bacterium]|nr:methylated-DNA--[protein]-cysteine S-methyltransferase [Candidatus Latescibacterota bacterium]
MRAEGRSVLRTPFGRVEVLWEGERILAVKLGPFASGDGVCLEEDDGFPYAELFLGYFRGEGVDLTKLPVADDEHTEFRRSVWRAARNIPYGDVRTYRQVARSIGVPKAARAVGAALARNPSPLVVPCHRVVGKGGRLLGFGAGLEWKRALLELETGRR